MTASTEGGPEILKGHGGDGEPTQLQAWLDEFGKYPHRRARGDRRESGNSPRVDLAEWLRGLGFDGDFELGEDAWFDDREAWPDGVTRKISQLIDLCVDFKIRFRVDFDHSGNNPSKFTMVSIGLSGR